MHSSRIVHSPVDGVEEVVVDPREVVAMHVPRDAGPPTNVHQTSSKLCPTLTLLCNNKHMYGQYSSMKQHSIKIITNSVMVILLHAPSNILIQLPQFTKTHGMFPAIQDWSLY